MNSPTPVIGSWFRGTDGDLFEVVAVDPDDDTIEVQHFDGTLEEFDQETWNGHVIAEVDAPEDWSGSVDVEPEDMDGGSESMFASRLSLPLDHLDRNEAGGYSIWPLPLDDRI